MNIAKLIIKNFLLLREVELDPGGLNILVESNNHGKSNISKAVEWF